MKRQQQAILSHLFQEARRLIHEGVPLPQVTAQLRVLKAVRAGVILVVIDPAVPPETKQDEQEEQSENT